MRDDTKHSDFIELEQALKLLLDSVTVTAQPQAVRIHEATGRIAATDYTAALQIPPFDRSPLDGYALSHTDFAANVSKQQPTRLRVSMKIYAGDAVSQTLEEGCAARIMTGGMIPVGADCVVRQEDTDCGETVVELYQAVGGGKNICYAGEDISVGARILSRGEPIYAPVISVMAGQGYASAQVFRRLRVGVISTGSELVSTSGGALLTDGKIYDSNGPMICARLAELGMMGEPETVGDEARLIAEKIRRFSKTCDAVITTGGVSVGEKDCLAAAIKLLGANMLFHGVSVKPGSPMLAASYQNMPVFALSGNPFAALATLELLVLPVLLKMSGCAAYHPERATAVLLREFPKKSDGRRLIRGRIDSSGVWIPDNHASGSIASSRGCNCFVDIPAGSGVLEQGTMVNAVLFFGQGILPEHEEFTK